MRIQQQSFYLLLLSMLCINSSYAAVFHANANGAWENSATWLEPGFPGAGDDVIIDGFIVTFSNTAGNVTINSLEITNANNTGTSMLNLTGDNTFAVTSNVEVNSLNDQQVMLQIQNNVVMTVGGSLVCERQAGVFNNSIMQLYMLDKAQLAITNNFIFYYNASGLSENNPEVLLTGESKLTVGAAATLSSSGGKELYFELRDKAEAYLNNSLTMQMTPGASSILVGSDSGTSRLEITGNATLTNSGGTGSFILGAGTTGGAITVTGDVNLTSSMAGAQAMLIASGPNAQVTVGGNINMSAVGNNSAQVGIINQSTLSLAGTINRPDSYGRLNMDVSSTLEFNGTSIQQIPASSVSELVTDSLFITNVAFSNTSGMPMALQGPLVVNEYLSLNSGVLVTSDTNLLTLSDGAGIDVGSPTAYVDGPIHKVGSTNGSSFVFPVGDQGTYAPLEISAVAAAASEYTAEYKSDPPPFGINAAKVGSISNNQYWNLDKAAGSEDVQITLNWADIGDDNFVDIDSLLVVGLNGGVWTSYGNGGTTGDIVASASGSVASKLSDPPPFGIVSFTVGSTVIGSLPVDLVSFNALQEDDEVFIQWQTATELNTQYFEIERSDDGVNFEMIDMVMSQGEGAEFRTYSTTDPVPYYGANFYRLKIVDKDGHTDYSTIAVVKFKMTPGVSIYPNPVAESFTIGGADLDSEDVLIEVFDRNGLRLFTDKVNFVHGTLRLTTSDINANVPGTYMIRVTLDNETQVLKLTKIE